MHNLNELHWILLGRKATPSVVVQDGRTLHSTPESGHHAGYDGAKKRKGSKAHVAVETLSQLLSVIITPANKQARAQVGELCRQVKAITGQTMTVGFVDQGYTGEGRSTRRPGMVLTCESLKNPKARRALSSYLSAGWSSADLPDSAA